MKAKSTSSSLRRIGSSACMLLALVCSVLVLPANQAGAQGGDVQDWLSKINGLRASLGLHPLEIDGELMGLAQGWSGHMASQGALSHTSNLAAGVSSNWSKLGENVGFGPNSDMIWNSFLNSPRHYANLTDPAFTHIGIGVTWSGGTQWVTHRFMGVMGGGGGGGSAPAPRAPAPRRSAPPAAKPSPPPVVEAPPSPPPPPPPPAEPARVAAVLDALRAAGA